MAVRPPARRQSTPSVAQAHRDAVADDATNVDLFWDVERTNDPSVANLTLEYPTLEVAASVVLPNGKKAVAADASHAAALVPPVLTNKTPVAKYTRLVAINDLNLQKIDEERELKRKQEREAKNAAKKQKTSE